MYYSIMPIEDLIDIEEDKKLYSYEEYSIKNGVLEVYKAGNDYTVKRIISTDPASYLNNTFQPGTVLTSSCICKLAQKDM